LSSQHKEMVNGHDSGQHASEIVELDTRKFRVAKQAQELEVEGERLEGELESLKARLAQLEDQGVEGDHMTRRSREVDDPTM
jgi:kinetochore protein Spc24